MKSYLLSAACTAALLTGVEAGAQDTDPPGETAGGREVIMVTARKREEDILDVPVAISSLSAEDAALLSLDGIEDYLRQLPSAVLVNAGPEYLTDVSIRGQGGGRVGFSETATGLYRNGIYIAGGGFGGRSLSRMDLFDMRRIEVLRGPQGALFGRNAVGGAMNVVSARPEFEFGGNASLTYTVETERTDLSAVVNMPLAEDVAALRIGGFRYDQEDGFHTNIRTGNTVDVSEHSGLRGSLLLAPSDNLDLLLTVERFSSTTPGFGNIGYRPTRTNGTTLDPDPYTRAMSDEAFVDIDQTNVFAIAEGETSFGTWRGSLSWAQRDGARVNEDLDHFTGFQDRVIAGQEVILFASQSEDFERTGGELYFASDDSRRFTWLFGAEFQTFTSDVLTINAGTTTVPGLRAALRADDSLEELTSYAAYAAFGLQATDRLDLGFEIRVQRDEKDFMFDRSRNQPDSLTTPFTVNLSESWTNVTPVATADFALSEAQTIYARVATGYRPGGFNNGIPDTGAAAQALIPYDPEYAVSGELGWKAEFGPFRFGAAAFYTHTQDAQVVTAASTTNNTFILQNAGDTTVYGIELEAAGTFDLGPGTLGVNAGISSNDGEFGDNTIVVVAGVQNDISGFRVNRTRDLNAQISANYFFPITTNLDAFISGSAQFERGGFENALNQRDLPDFELFDARVGLRAEHWSMSVFGRNLTDERYRIQTVSSNEYWSPGRVWGVRLGTRF